MKLHRRRQQFIPPAPSFDETPFVTVPVPETPTIPSAAKRWRSGALHPVPETPTIPSAAKRWRSGTLHLENPVSKRFRRLRDTQSDPSEGVKRSRLAPAQVMSTALAKHCDWSLGFDGRSPVFDETQDWRHSIFLTGRAARIEVYFASESPENQRLLQAVVTVFLGSFLRSTRTLELWFCRCRFCILASRRNRTVTLAHDAKTTTTTRM